MFTSNLEQVILTTESYKIKKKKNNPPVSEKILFLSQCCRKSLGRWFIPFDSLREMHIYIYRKKKSISIKVFFFKEIHFEYVCPMPVSNSPPNLSIPFKCLKKSFRLSTYIYKMPINSYILII